MRPPRRRQTRIWLAASPTGPSRRAAAVRALTASLARASARIGPRCLHSVIVRTVADLLVPREGTGPALMV
eukprot:13244545-Alexandrium_andersonii.AAC.1